MLMNATHYLILLCLSIVKIPVSGEGETASEQTLKFVSSTEADAIISSRMKAHEKAENSRRESIEAKTAERTWEFLKRDGSGMKTIFRRVSPPPAPAAAPKNELSGREWTEEEMADFLGREAEGKPRLDLSLSATVYDAEITEMRLWHDGERYKILSNVPFSYLQVIGNFEDETAQWSYFGMVDRVDIEKEARYAERAKAFGGEYTPRPRPDRSLFRSMEFPEYLVLAERDQVIPEDVFARLDAIHAYYLANEEKLAIRYQRREALAEANRKWREENPEEPKDTIINFWPIRSRSAPGIEVPIETEGGTR